MKRMGTYEPTGETSESEGEKEKNQEKKAKE